MRSPQVEVGNVVKSVPESDYWFEWYSYNTRAWSTVILQERLLSGKYMPSPRVMLATVLPRQRWPWCDVTTKSCWRWCFQGDGATEATWARHDVGAESSWWWHYRGNLATTRCQCWVMLAIALSRRLGHGMMYMPSFVGDGVVEATWPWHDVYAESCWWWCCQCDLAVARCHCRRPC
jgi:hypothetical protein